MTASDVNSVTKPWDAAVGVTKSLFTEFFMQARCCNGVLVVSSIRSLTCAAPELLMWTQSYRATRSAQWACSRS